MKTSKIESDASGGIDNVTLALQMALLFAIEINDITKREDAEGKFLLDTIMKIHRCFQIRSHTLHLIIEIISRMPLLCENGLLEDLICEMKNPNKKWECPGLAALTQFALGVSVAGLRTISIPTFPRGKYSRARLYRNLGYNLLFLPSFGALAKIVRKYITVGNFHKFVENKI